MWSCVLFWYITSVFISQLTSHNVLWIKWAIYLTISKLVQWVPSLENHCIATKIKRNESPPALGARQSNARRLQRRGCAWARASGSACASRAPSTTRRSLTVRTPRVAPAVRSVTYTRLALYIFIIFIQTYEFLY